MVMDGLTAEGFDMVEVLPDGALRIDQVKVNAWPSTSVDDEPSS